MSLVFRAIASAAALFGVASCGGDPPISKTVPFEDLAWKADVYLLDDKPFTGTAIAYHKDGTTKKSEIGLREGRYHGVVREWWENGNLQTETGFENGKRHGKNTYWDEDGKLIKEQIYETDVVIEEKVYQ